MDRLRIALIATADDAVRPVHARCGCGTPRPDVELGETIRGCPAPGPRRRIVVLALLVLGATLGASSGLGLLLFLPYASVGGLLAMRRPRTAIGWIFLGIAGCFASITTTLDATIRQFADGTVATPLGIFAVVWNMSGVVAFFLFAILALVFPSGRLPTGRWGTILRLTIATGLVLLTAALFMPNLKVQLVGYAETVSVRNPLAFMPDHVIWQVITPDNDDLPAHHAAAGRGGDLARRARPARDRDRAPAASLVHGLDRGRRGSRDRGHGSLPSSFRAGAQRVRLDTGNGGIHTRPDRGRHRRPPIPTYEIDRIISRTVSWALGSGVLVLAFAGGVVALQALLSGFTQGETLAVAASTLIAYALFQPVRRRIQRAVDRRFDRARYDGQKVIDTFPDSCAMRSISIGFGRRCRHR